MSKASEFAQIIYELQLLADEQGVDLVSYAHEIAELMRNDHADYGWVQRDPTAFPEKFRQVIAMLRSRGTIGRAN